MVAIRSPGARRLPTVRCIESRTARPPPKEHTMNRITAQAVSLSLALLMTVVTLAGLETLAGSQHNAAQQTAAAIEHTA